MRDNIVDKILNVYCSVLRYIVFALVIVSGLSVIGMILITCGDVLLRRFSITLTGAYDLVKVLSTVTLACALPYTTAVKGHVAIEYFFHKLGRGSRLVLDSIMRTISTALFGFLGVRSFMYGSQLYRSGQVTQTLQLPIFWIAYLIGFCCIIMAMVIFYSLVRPNREMIKL